MTLADLTAGLGDSGRLPKAHVVDVCRLGRGAECCSFLMAGIDGLECAKGGPAESEIRRRRFLEQMTAQGDNCPGWQAQS